MRIAIVTGASSGLGKEYARLIDAQINHLVNKMLRIFNLPDTMIEWQPK